MFSALCISHGEEKREKERDSHLHHIPRSLSLSHPLVAGVRAPGPRQAKTVAVRARGCFLRGLGNTKGREESSNEKQANERASERPTDRPTDRRPWCAEWGTTRRQQREGWRNPREAKRVVAVASPRDASVSSRAPSSVGLSRVRSGFFFVDVAPGDPHECGRDRAVSPAAIQAARAHSLPFARESPMCLHP